MTHLDPAAARAQAYQEQKARLDRKTRSQNVRCVAPNRRCGSRCIPPNWDCRLKGEGNDGHLRALGKGSDPVSGLANIERGLGRLRIAAVKLSFSELEGSRKAIARGTAKLAPGDLKRKQEIKERTDFFLGRVALPVAAVIGAGLLHKGLKNFRGYREGVGQQVDDSARSAINLVRENIPFYGAVVRRRKQAGREAVAATGRAFSNYNTTGANSLFTNAGQRRTLTQMVRRQPGLNNEGFSSASRDLLDTSLRQVDGTRRKPSQLDFNEWHTRSMASFWGTETSAAVTPAGITRKSNLFSLHATNDLLAKSFGLPAPTGADLKQDGEQAIRRMRELFSVTGDRIRTAMREEGLDFKNVDTVRSYIGRNQAGTPSDERATQILTNAVIRTDYETQARTLYNDTLASYDQLFRKVSDDIAQAPSIDLIQNRGSATERAALQERRRNSYFNDAVEAHSSYLGQRLSLRAPVYGSYTGRVARLAYYARFVAGSRQLPNNNAIAISLTRTEAFNAGIEIAKATGTPEPKTVEAALDLVVRTYGRGSGLEQGPYGGYAIGQIGLVTGSASPRPRRPNPSSTASADPPEGRPSRRRSMSRASIIRDLLKQRNRDGNPAYTPESAATEADRIIAQRNRSDARADTYLLVRQDFTPPNERDGQPCGKSFIPRRAKCSKPTSARYADKPEPEQGEGLAGKLGKAALAAGAVAGGIGLYKNRRPIGQGLRLAKNTIKSERKLYNAIKARKLSEKNSYGRAKYSPEASSRAARREYVENRQQAVRAATPKFAEMAVQKLSTKQVYEGLDRLPAQLQPGARKLVGKAKTVAVNMGLRASGMEMVSVNDKNNFATYRATDGSGSIASVGSVGDSLIIYNSQKKGEIQGVGRYGMAFTVDRKFDQRQGLAADQAKGIVATTKAMFEEQKAQLPNNAFVFNIAYQDDGLGKKRVAAYKRMGFRPLPKGGEMWAIKDQGKFRKLSDDELEALMRILQGRKDAEEKPTRVQAFLAIKEALAV